MGKRVKHTLEQSQVNKFIFHYGRCMEEQEATIYHLIQVVFDLFRARHIDENQIVTIKNQEDTQYWMLYHKGKQIYSRIYSNAYPMGYQDKIATQDGNILMGLYTYLNEVDNQKRSH